VNVLAQTLVILGLATKMMKECLFISPVVLKLTIPETALSALFGNTKVSDELKKLSQSTTNNHQMVSAVTLRVLSGFATTIKKRFDGSYILLHVYKKSQEV